MDPNLPVTVSLEAQEWQQVLDVLTTGTYRVVAPLIVKIAQQAQAQADAQMVPEPRVVAPTSALNGQHPAAAIAGG